MKDELSKAHQALVSQREQITKLIDELLIAKKELVFQNEEKIKRADELLSANKELVFQNEEKIKRADELLIANKERVFQNEEKIKRADELLIANKERAFQNEVLAKQSVELQIALIKAINNEKMQAAFMETISIARLLVEVRDPYTAGHQKHVGDLAKAIASDLGFDGNYQEGIMIAGYLHDIGKIIVPIEILSKPGKLMKNEFNLVKDHAQAGYEILKGITFPWDILEGVLGHHERLNGSGYPHGLKGDEISIDARILAVADVVDAMLSLRPYRASLGVDAALDEIERGRNTLYDGAVVDVCLNLFREKSYKIEPEPQID